MPKLLTPQQIADYLGVKPSTIYQWTHQGFIPHVKLGRLVRFREADVAKWIEKRSEKGRKTRSVDTRELGLQNR
jgi:excisionase family DNA binding protein